MLLLSHKRTTIYESKTGNFLFNEDGDSAIAGALLFSNAKGISDTYWIAVGVMCCG